MMALSGVRRSWLIAERKAPLRASLAARAACVFASASLRIRSRAGSTVERLNTGAGAGSSGWLGATGGFMP